MKKEVNSFLYYFLVFVQISTFVYGQVTGLPGIQNYNSKDYKQHEQNWTIVQDKHGLMYFGNSNGLLEYDGVSWRFIKTTNPDIVRSLAVDQSNNIFVGGYNYFGRLEADSTNRLIFKSLSDMLDPAYKKFYNVWNINVTSHGIYFQTDSALFRWSDDKFDIWKTSSPGNRSFVVRDTLYMIQVGKGLAYLRENKFVCLEGGELFSENKIYAMKPFGKNKAIIGTRTQGLFICSRNKISPFKTEIDEYLLESMLTDIVRLNDGNLGIASRENGLAIIDESGQLIQYINKEKGLTDNTIWKMYPDNQFGLWVASNNGISRIEIPSPITHFNENFGIEGTVESIVAHKGQIFISTALGLYYINPSQTPASLHKAPDIRPYKIISAGKTLLASGYNSGIYEFRNEEVRFLYDYSGYSFCRSKLDSNRVYIGLEDAIASIYFRNNQWIDEGHLHLGTTPIRDVVETFEGNLWLRTSGPQLCRITLTNEKFTWQKAKVELYDEKNGLLPSTQNYIFTFGKEVFFNNKNHLLTFDDQENHFRPYTKLMDILSDTSYAVYGFNDDIKKNIWMLLSNNDGNSVGMVALEPSGQYNFKTAPFVQLSGEYFYSIYPDKNRENVVWLGGPGGIIRYDLGIKKDYSLSYPCLIRSVITQNDSLVWSGPVSESINKSEKVSLEYIDNALRFAFAAPFYENEKATLFQYYLEGFDNNWSNWKNETKADYTNIPEGHYTFRVKAKNIYNTISEQAIFKFNIWPPWYRSWWAYSIYGVFIFALIIGLIKLRSLKLEMEKAELEKIIKDRTNDIIDKNKQLEDQAEKLQELDKLKSRFFANISHEFRTPLTLIKGPVEEMLNDRYRGKPDNAFKVILRNANNLLRLINQMLDLSKLESGGMKLQVALQPVSAFISVMVNLFSSLAETRNILLQYVEPDEEVEVYFDSEKLEKILCNLLSNAFKFTPEDGCITVSLQSQPADEKLYPDGSIKINICDTGIGIPDEQIINIFERFNQGQNTKNGIMGGSGIGLALTRELVELHHGEITVSSMLGEGTKFEVTLPLGSNHLKPDEIIEENSLESYACDSKTIQPDEFEVAESPEKEQEEVKNNAAKELVLIIEDNTDVRNYIRQFLENTYQIMESENGAKGALAAKEHLPDLIISDVMMPEMDGYELTDTLKKDPLTSHIPIILLTAKASDEAKIEGLETGADAYMAKPFNAAELETRVKKLIEMRSRLREKFRRDFFLEPSEINAAALGDKLLSRMHQIIEKEMHDPQFNVEVLLKEFSLGTKQFTRKVIALTGQTPLQYIRVIRLKRAMKLINQGAGSVSQIAFEVGFNNLSYFSKCFQQQFGKLPSEIAPQNNEA